MRLKIEFHVGDKADHLRHEAADRRIRRRIGASSIHKWQLTPMHIDAYSPLTRQIAGRTGVVEMTVGQHNRAGNRLVAKLLAYCRQYVGFISGSTRIYQYPILIR